MLFIIIPIMSSIFCGICRDRHIFFVRFFSLFSLLLVFLLSIFFWIKDFYFHSIHLYHGYWKEEIILPWISILGIDFHLGMDGLSLMMISLSSILGIISILSSWKYKSYNGFFYMNLFLLFTGTIGTLLSIDLFLFFCFWEMMIIPVYFIMIFWGNKKYQERKRIFTSNKFLLYTQISSILMLFSIILLSLNFYHETNIFTFNYNYLIHGRISFPIECLIMLGFFVAFAVKLPILPFHGWLPDFHNQSPVDSSIDLSGLLIKVGAYGLLRFNISLFQKSSHYFLPLIIALSLMTAFYGAFMAFSEKQIKKIISYSSISHMGFILMAIYCENVVGHQGAIIQIVFSALSTSALFIIFSHIYHCFKISSIDHLSGIYTSIKWIPGFFMFFIFTNLNFPGTINFIGEIMMLTGIFYKFQYVACILIFSLFFSFIYSINIIHKIFYGIQKNIIIKVCQQINNYEFFLFIFFIFIIVFLGLFPNIILSTIHDFNKTIYIC
ncbi:NuoM family protein [Buchnera aphidicola]|uniref:complex I subunit 4 family protein n=1 Tax=Buchnera aphidicola TaxID=9 RepID=UPI003464E032